jgi:hypothetical protein
MGQIFYILIFLKEITIQACRFFCLFDKLVIILLEVKTKFLKLTFQILNLNFDLLNFLGYLIFLSHDILL